MFHTGLVIEIGHGLARRESQRRKNPVRCMGKSAGPRYTQNHIALALSQPFQAFLAQPPAKALSSKPFMNRQRGKRSDRFVFQCRRYVRVERFIIFKFIYQAGYPDTHEFCPGKRPHGKRVRVARSLIHVLWTEYIPPLCAIEKLQRGREELIIVWRHLPNGESAVVCHNIGFIV